MKPSSSGIGRRGVRKRRGEVGFSLLGAIFLVLTLGTLGLSMTSITSTKAVGSAYELQGQQAFYVAEAGLQYAIAKDFYGDMDYSNNVAPTNPPYGTGAISLGAGQFWIEYSNLTTNSGVVLATSRVGEGVRKIQQVVKRDYLASGAIQAGGNVDLKLSQGGVGTVIGDVLHTGNLTNQGYSITGNIQANSPLPASVNYPSYVLLTTATHTGDLAINGNYSGNVHVTGNVTINNSSGTVTGVIAADGDVTIAVQQGGSMALNGTIASAGNITADLHQESVSTFTAQGAGGSMQPILASQGNITLNLRQESTLTVRGLMHSTGNFRTEIRQEANFQIQGAIMSVGNTEIDTKQEAVFKVDYGAGSSYLGVSAVKLENWKEL